MKSQQLFTDNLPELEQLPERPSIFWYVSAGKDLGPVFLTDAHRLNESMYHGRHFTKPDLFVFSCMGPEVEELKENLSQGRVELFSDRLTTITGFNYKPLNVSPELNLNINTNYIETSHVNTPKTNQKAFYFEIEITGDTYSEIQKILYFEHENIDTYNKIIKNGPFEVMYLCATREGMAWGNCKKSIIEHIYQDSGILQSIENGFKPKYNILFHDFTNHIFTDAAENATNVEITTGYGHYIYEGIDNTPNNIHTGYDNAIIHKIEYLQPN